MISRKFRFDGWVLDPESGDLERDGVRVRLQEQPGRVLLELLANAGRVVTREQIIGLLWPRGVVDFDTSLNTVIRKLRSALGDTAETPRYIETLPRRGYRFIGAIDPDPVRVEGAADPTIVGPGADPAMGPGRITICVLPFTNLSDSNQENVLCDAISQDIITELSRWRQLEVRSRLATLRYRDSSPEIARVASELSVRFAVEGSVRRIGDRVRINVQLVDGASGQQVWADRIDRNEADIFVVQDELVQRIVSTLVGRVRVSDTDRARRKHPSSLQAYECVLRGNALPWDEPAAAAEATRLFERAIQIDSQYGLAHAMLAIMRHHEWQMGVGEAPARLEEAYQLAMRAVELDDSESTCHSMLAQVCLQKRAFELALKHMQRAVELNPNNQWNIADMAIVLAYSGHAQEAEAWSARAKQVDPYFDPPWYWRQSGRIQMTLRLYREALERFDHLPRRNFKDCAYMAACYARLGEISRARQLADECLVSQPAFTIRGMMRLEPFRRASDAGHLEESFRLAALPE